jgi:hypothetical protein
MTAVKIVKRLLDLMAGKKQATYTLNEDQAGRVQANVKSAAGKTPGDKEMAEALKCLKQSRRRASYGTLGGSRPDKDNRLASWWGGNFSGLPGEDLPVNSATGNTMQPVCQINVADLPNRPEALDGIALLTFWMDLKTPDWWEGGNGSFFCVRTYPSLDGLVALGPGYRDKEAALPTFPVKWLPGMVRGEAPSWEDFAGKIPRKVAESPDADWFFDNHTGGQPPECAVKAGGWPQWIQGSQWPRDARFALQINSTGKGRMMLGDSGSIYLFRTRDDWLVRGDCY